jgi:hypothetical protein
MSSCFLQEIGVDVNGMEKKAAFRKSSSALPQVDWRARSNSDGAIRRFSGSSPASYGTAKSGWRSEISLQIQKHGGRPNSSSGSTGSRPGSSTGCARPKVLIVDRTQPTSWELGRLRDKAQQASCAKCANPPMALEGIAAVLFLDIDGVLHPYHIRHPRQQFQRNCMTLLKDAMVASQATIVLSTAWREDPESRQIVAEKLAEHGLPPFVSKTPSIARFRRTREILAWVKKYRPHTWVAVDDLPLLEENPQEMKDHFVNTDPKFGMRQQDADQIVQLFCLQRKRLTTPSPCPSTN